MKRTRNLLNKNYALHCLLIFVLIVLLSNVAASIAAPYVPEDDGAVIYTLTNQVGDKDAIHIRELRTRLNVSKNKSSLAIELAQAYLRLGQDNNDPRYYGLAESVLQPWWNTTTNKNILLLKMSILQFGHNFSQAMNVLNQIEKIDPNNVQVPLQRANLYRLTGEYDLSIKACEALSWASLARQRNICLASIEGLRLSSVEARQKTKKLRAMMQLGRDLSADEKLWSLQVIAELLYAHGYWQEAKSVIQQGLDIKPSDIYLLAMYADILLQNKDYVRVIEVLTPHYQYSPLLVRLLIAEDALDSPDFQNHKQIMQARWRESELSGDQTHARELTLYLLYVEKNIPKAMEFALINWQSQKEITDAVLLYTVAQSMQDTEVIKKVNQWQEYNNISIDLNKLVYTL